MASSDVNHAQTIGRSTNSTDSKDSTGSDKPYSCFEPKNQLSNSIHSNVKSTDSQCRSQCQTEEEVKASNRTSLHTITQNEGRGLSKAGYSDSESDQTITGDSLNSTKNEIEDNYCKEKGHDNHGCANSGSIDAIPEDSLHSNIPTFRTPIGEQQYQPRKTECKILWRDSETWPPILHSLSNETKPPAGINLPNNNEDMTFIANNRLFPNIYSSGRDSHYSTETVIEPPTGINLHNNNEGISYIADNRLFSNIDSSDNSDLEKHHKSKKDLEKHHKSKKDLEKHHKSKKDLEKHHKSKKNCPLRIMILIILIGCISGVAAWVIQNKYFLGSKDTPTAITDDLPDFPDKCENDISIARVGEQMCIPYTQKFTSSPSEIYVRQKSSQYLSVLQGFSVNVSSDEFEQQSRGWIINFNSSRTDQQLRFMMGRATCDSVGIYEITIKYDDGNVSSGEFEIKLKDPQLQHSVSRINDSIHVHCEMIKTCVASSLVLFVNDGGSSRMIPNINVCSDNHQESGTTVSADAIIPASWLSGNMTISCVPLMTDSGLAANLTSTIRIPACEGDCVPDCKDDPQSEAYFPDKNDCSKFYQCSNGKLVFQTCGSSTYWSPSKCTCDHFDDEICNKDTNKFFKPLLAIEKCTKTSLV